MQSVGRVFCAWTHLHLPPTLRDGRSGSPILQMENPRLGGATRPRGEPLAVKHGLTPKCATLGLALRAQQGFRLASDPGGNGTARRMLGKGSVLRSGGPPLRCSSFGQCPAGGPVMHPTTRATPPPGVSAVASPLCSQFQGAGRC